MIGHRISFSDNLQKLKFSGRFLRALCVAMVTDMMSQVLSSIVSQTLHVQQQKLLFTVVVLSFIYSLQI